MKFGFFLGISTFFLAGPALATETTTYEYDELGRLIKSNKSGGPASGVQKTTTFDPAGNRINQTVTGVTVAGSAGNANFIILPIVGFVMLPNSNGGSGGAGGGSGGGSSGGSGGTGGGSGGGGSSVTTLTDSNLLVLPAHTNTYMCVSFVLFGAPVDRCWLTSNNVTVYSRSTYGGEVLDPGYSLAAPRTLKVQAANYGTGIAP